jgi:hypothetical protein
VNAIHFNTFDSQALGALFELPDCLISLQLYMIGFVDDSSGQTNAFGKHLFGA